MGPGAFHQAVAVVVVDGACAARGCPLVRCTRRSPALAAMAGTCTRAGRDAIVPRFIIVIDILVVKVVQCA